MEWQDIESAPRDGTRVLLGQFNDKRDFYGRMAVDWWRTEGGSHSYTGFGQFNKTYWPATHWMPLPAPPPSPPPRGDGVGELAEG